MAGGSNSGVRYTDDFKKEVVDFYNENGTNATLQKFKLKPYTLDYFKGSFKKTGGSVRKETSFGDQTMVSIPVPQTRSDNVFIVCCKPHQLGSVMKGLSQ